jgi:hypothetical protein
MESKRFAYLSQKLPKISEAKIKKEYLFGHHTETFFITWRIL